MREPPAEVRDLAVRRAQARQAKEFATADALRGQIAAAGWTVTDGPDGFSLAPAGKAAGPPGYRVLPDPAAIPPAARRDPDRVATVALLVEGWPADLRECVAALLAHVPAGVIISGLDVGNVEGAGDTLHELAVAHPGRIEDRHVAAGHGWGSARNALLQADPGPMHIIMETSTILTGDAISPLLAAAAADGVVAAGWRGADPDPDLRGFHDAGPGPVAALLCYLLAVRTDAAVAVGGLPVKARFYRNADLEFSLKLGRVGRLVVPAEPLPVRQGRHRGYHDSDRQVRDRESSHNYRRVLELLRGGGEA
jgi:hypothetical protein